MSVHINTEQDLQPSSQSSAVIASTGASETREHGHTPTPWAYDCHPIEGTGNPFAEIWSEAHERKIDIAYLTLTKSVVANAAFIVQAANNHDALIEMLSEWLAFAEDKFGEFDIEGEDDCYSENLCPQCQSNGCIQYKIRRARKLIETNL